MTEQQREEFRARYLAGEDSSTLVSDFPFSESLFWSVVRDLREARIERQHSGMFERLQALPPEAKGWAAGIIDGEGWIGISRLRPKYFQPRIDVVSTTRVMQMRLQFLLAGHVSKKKNAAPCRDTWRWSMWSITGVRAVLETLLPYFVVKQKVAAEVHTFCIRHARVARCAPTTIDEKIYARVRALNKRGRDDKDPPDD